MEIYNYNDGMLSGSRTPRLYLVKGLEFRKFGGSSISGFCAVKTAQYNKNGKWSNTDYSIVLHPGVKTYRLCSPMHGRYGDNAGSWGELVAETGLPYEVVKGVVEAEYPTTAKRLNELEAFMAELPAETEMEEVIISFGSPTNRQISEGWWEAPKHGYTTNNVDVEITPDLESGFEKCTATRPRGAKVTNIRYSPGMHGGYYTVSVMVPTNSVEEIVAEVPEPSAAISPAVAVGLLKNIFG